LQKPNPSDTDNKVPDPTPKCRIPETELNLLNRGFGIGNVPPFPYSIDLIPKNAGDTINSPATKMVVRHLEEEDIPRILPEVVREFGSLISSPQSNEPGDELATQIENYLFSLTVLIGLTQRVKRRIKGYPMGTQSVSPDHNVICIVEQIPIICNGEIVSYSEQIVGIGEISWQPPNPNRNAPPFVLPYFVKQLIAKFGSVVDENGIVLDAPRGYISNVLVYKNRRGLGYGRVLMAALEGIGKMWGCKDVSLHVDADEKSGRVAQGLYRKLGYVGVPDTCFSKSKGDRVGYEWMGPSMANQGLYMVDGIPLIYMRKVFD
jgi:ribosomal protein S18 acetylase RimI-like enzyme